MDCRPQRRTAGRRLVIQSALQTASQNAPRWMASLFQADAAIMLP